MNNKGAMNAHQLQIELGIAFYHGYTVAKCEGFADSLGIPATELTRRLGSLLAPAAEVRQPLGLPDSLHVLRGETGARSQPVEPLALDERTYGSPRSNGTLPGGAAQEDPPREALTTNQKISAGQRAAWARLTPTEQTQKSLNRFLAIKHKTPADKKAIATLRAKLAGKETPRQSMQAIYSARTKARRLGLPMPPLPGEKDIVPGESKEERRKRIDRESHQRRRDAQKAAAGKLKGRSKAAAAGKTYWSGMTPVERSAEMNRRVEVRKKNKRKNARASDNIVWNRGKAGAQPERQEAEAATGT